ncbi:hypothetical protein C1S82_21430 [Mycolicibacterium cosmeticum]|uniref:Keratin associated protein n=2 Tax=Mycolicibacterium cosmeticum TaxID=258533 RepID=W9AN18_MYCCO|nr:hypothetical protein C1S82_21430 [Mycolicibacterium cosmeticum]CDO07109.1 hypothetical protein BN977_01908 [Mycolicibacterium cosmeticum]
MRSMLVLSSLLAAAALQLAPTAAADPNSNLPSCTSVGGTEAGGAATECASPGNVQLNASPPAEPTYPYPWDDEFYGPALIIGGEGGGGWHGGGGGHR